MILGVMLGVAVMVAIDLANAAASRAFDLSTDAIAGKATHQIVGGPTGLDETIYTRLRVEGGVRLAAPVVTEYVSSPQLGDRPIELLGVDPFAEAPFRSFLLTGNAARATGFGRETSPDSATSASAADCIPDAAGRAADLRGAGARRTGSPSETRWHPRSLRAARSRAAWPGCCNPPIPSAAAPSTG